MYKSGMLLTAILIASALTLSPVLLNASVLGQTGGAKLPPNSVTSPTIVDGQVLSQDLGKGAVSADNLRSSSVTSSAIADGQVLGQDLGKGAVSTDNLRAGSVTNPIIADKAVTSDKIFDGTILKEDIKPGEIIGEPGPPGPAGPAGPPGPTQTLRIVSVAGPDTLMPVGQGGKSTATCPEGTTAVSGGYQISVQAHVIGEFRIEDGESGRSGWVVSAVNDSPTEGNLLAIANCATLNPT